MRRAAARGLALAMVLGCACDEDTQLGRVAPELVVTPERLDFGAVPLAATRRLDVEVQNVGNAPLNVSSVDAAAPFLAADGPLEVFPGESIQIAVGFRPTNDEAQQGTLRLMTDDPDQPTVEITLSGRGAEGNLTVTPTEVSFEGTKVGTTRSVDLVLDNVGLDAVEGLIRTDTFQPEHFSLSGLTEFASGGRFSVGARARQVLELRYQPRAAGRHDGRIVFEICGERCGIEVDVDASADISAVRLVPALVDFGTVGIGETATELLSVTNDGADPIEVRAVRALGQSDVQVNATRGLPATVPPGAALGLNVELSPSSALPIEAEIEVDVGPVQETLRAAVIGQGEGPRFEVEPAQVNFGVERGPGTYQRPVLLLNAGSARVEVRGLELSGDPAFALGPTPVLPTGLGPGESLVVDVLFSPTMIAEYTGALRVASDDPLRPVVEVPVRGGLSDRICEIDLRPSRVTFGLLPPTFTRVLPATLQNVGQDTCEILSGAFRVPAEPSFTVAQAPWPVSLPPGGTVQLDFQYAPVVEADAKATYVLQTSDPVFPERAVPLSGTSRGNLDVFAVPSAVDFGASRLGCPPVSRQVMLVNAGTIDVSVGSLTLTATTGELSLGGSVPPTPFPLPAGVSRSLEVRHQPADLGPDVAFLEVGVPDFGLTLTVPLQGAGALDPRITDVFEQSSNDVVDVLFVIDDSCSMGDNQRALANNFSAFIQQADLRQVDFQLGVTTTTLFPTPGHIVGAIMTPQTANLEDVFRSTVNVGAAGSGFERGMEAMLGVLQSADRGVGLQARLLRPDATRVVVFVGDEDDQSPLPVARYFQELRQRSPNGFTVGTVSGQAFGCTGAVPAPRFEQLVALSGGVSTSICSAWSQTLSRIGQVAFGLRRRFPLTRDADPSRPIDVYVDGQLQTQGVQYDPVDNSVVFTTAPPEEAEVRVEYSPTC